MDTDRMGIEDYVTLALNQESGTAPVRCLLPNPLLGTSELGDSVGPFGCRTTETWGAGLSVFPSDADEANDVELVSVSPPLFTPKILCLAAIYRASFSFRDSVDADDVWEVDELDAAFVGRLRIRMAGWKAPGSRGAATEHVGDMTRDGMAAGALIFLVRDSRPHGKRTYLYTYASSHIFWFVWESEVSPASSSSSSSSQSSGTDAAG